MLPARFKNVIFIKAGDYAIARCERDDPSVKVRSIVTQVLYAPQIEHLVGEGAWHTSGVCEAITSTAYPSLSPFLLRRSPLKARGVRRSR